MWHVDPQSTFLSEKVNPRKSKHIYTQQGWWWYEQNEEWIVTLQKQERKGTKLGSFEEKKGISIHVLSSFVIKFNKHILRVNLWSVTVHISIFKTSAKADKRNKH